MGQIKENDNREIGRAVCGTMRDQLAEILHFTLLVGKLINYLLVHVDNLHNCLIIVFPNNQRIIQ
jgi:hypothetical protein